MTAALFPDLVVNGEAISHKIVAAEAQNHPAPRDKPGIAWRKAANAIAVRTLLLQEARRRGLVPAPAELGAGRFETEDEALIRGLLDVAVQVESPSGDMVRAEWERDPSRFRAPPLWEVSHILCACDPRDDQARRTAGSVAADLTRRVRNAPRDFARIAAENSDCGSKASGGSLGQLGPGDTVPEFEAALRALSEGETTAQPVLTRHGYHIIRMDAVAAGQVLPFHAVSAKIADALEKACWVRAAKAFTDDLIRGARITGADFGTV